ncbi:MAG: hypothetical protein H6736_21165 [Alphaproteobacteria bacterium]|nr:hypothetical protein [Alphaproteobacteria bacterium]
MSNSIFNMIMRKQPEGKLNDFLAWALEMDPGAAKWLFQRAGLDGVEVDTVTSRERATGGVPDLVLRGHRNDEPVVLAVELKLGAHATPLQVTEYQSWRAQQELNGSASAFLLLGPHRRADLAGAAGTHYVDLEDVFQRLDEGGVQVSLAVMARHARVWFVDPEVDADDLVYAIESNQVPYWPVKHMVKELQGRVTRAGLVAGRFSSSQARNPPYLGFFIERGGARVGWAGFYLFPTSTPKGAGDYFDGKLMKRDVAFWASFVEGALSEEQVAKLGIKVSPNSAYPLGWSPAGFDDRRWSAGRLSQAGFDDLVRAVAGSE